MGIPSFFKHISNHHRAFVKPIQLDAIYMDSNSIIYDSYYSIQNDETLIFKDELSFEVYLYDIVSKRIIEKIQELTPSKMVIIAFDGVAPMAKLEQQRTRRIKSDFLKKIKRRVMCSPMSTPTPTIPTPDMKFTPAQWNTSAITPGTQFMNNLNDYLQKSLYHAQQFGQLPPVSELTICISGTNEVGEGEHKIMNWIRSQPDYHKHMNVGVYGLDADLILLCLYHQKYCNRLLLFREIPEYDTDLLDLYRDSGEKETLYCYLDTKKLRNEIIAEMKSGQMGVYYDNKIIDYIFIVSMLGNDFLPHSPYLNIRTTGIDTLMNCYRAVVPTDRTICKMSSIIERNPNVEKSNKPNKYISIDWKLFSQMIEKIAQMERELMKSEMGYIKRKKTQYQKKYIYNRGVNGVKGGEGVDMTDLMDKFQQFPQIHREKEYYIDPYSIGWKSRYYEVLCSINVRMEPEKMSEMVRNYLYGMEWVIHYYLIGCPDWEWKFTYSYPPLCSDIMKVIRPIYDSSNYSFIHKTIGDEMYNIKPVHPLIQLSYVLPYSSYSLLPKSVNHIIEKYLTNNGIQLSDEDEQSGRNGKNDSKKILIPDYYEWAYCTYFWEAHISHKITRITIEELTNLIMPLMNEPNYSLSS